MNEMPQSNAQGIIVIEMIKKYTLKGKGVARFTLDNPDKSLKILLVEEFGRKIFEQVAPKLVAEKAVHVSEVLALRGSFPEWYLTKSPFLKKLETLESFTNDLCVLVDSQGEGFGEEGSVFKELLSSRDGKLAIQAKIKEMSLAYNTSEDANDFRLEGFSQEMSRSDVACSFDNLWGTLLSDSDLVKGFLELYQNKSRSAEEQQELQRLLEEEYLCKEVVNQELLRAAKSGEAQKVKALLGLGADVNATDVFSNTPIMVAVEGHDHECLNALMEHHADLTYVNFRGDTPLTLACMVGFERGVELLSGEGCKEYDHRHDGEHTPALNVAIQYDHLECAKILLGKNQEQGELDGALLLSISLGRSVDFVQTLLAYGAKADCALFGGLPISQMIEKTTDDVFALLVEGLSNEQKLNLISLVSAEQGLALQTKLEKISIIGGVCSREAEANPSLQREVSGEEQYAADKDESNEPRVKKRKVGFDKDDSLPAEEGDFIDNFTNASQVTDDGLFPVGDMEDYSA